MEHIEALKILFTPFPKTPADAKGFQDQYGYIVHSKDQKPNALGEATLYTAISIIAIATSNYKQDDWDRNNANQKLRELLTVLLKKSWGNKDGLGRKHPIRHTEDIDYYKDGGNVKVRMSPLSKDSFCAIVAAAYYAYTCPNSDQEVRTLARDLITKWVEYLIIFQWRTHSTYLENEFSRDPENKKKYYSIYSDINLINKKMYKGIESFMLWPHEIYALQNVAAHLGIPTYEWNIWGNIPAELRQTIIDYAVPYLADIAGKALDEILKNFHYAIPYRIPLGVSNWSFGIIEGAFEVEISSSVREQIVNTFEQAIKDLIREIVRLRNFADYQKDELKSILINRILNFFPEVLGPDSWRSILTSALEQVVPWLHGTIWIEALTFLGSLQLLKIDDPLIQEMNPSVISYTFWAYAAECETKPEMTDLLKPAIQDFYSFLRGNDNPNSLWAWLAEDSGRVSEHLELFKSNTWNHWWKFAYGELKFNDWFAEPNDASKQEDNEIMDCPRLDYLVLDGLFEKGFPVGVTDIISDWIEKFKDLVKEASKQFIQNLTAEVQRQFNQLGYYTREITTQAGMVIRETWYRTLEFSRDTILQGNLVASSTWDEVGDIIHNLSVHEGTKIEEYWKRLTESYWKAVWIHGNMVEQITDTLDGKAINEYWNRSTEKYWRGVWSKVNGTAEDMIERVTHTLDGKAINEYWNRSTEKYWKGVWSKVNGTAEDMIERVTYTLDGKAINEYWNRSTEKYWKGVWSKVNGTAEDMIERVTYTLDGKAINEYWNRSTEKYWKGVWSKVNGTAEDMIERIVEGLNGEVVQEIWSQTGGYGKSIFNVAGDLIESIGDIAPISLPSWIPRNPF